MIDICKKIYGAMKSSMFIRLDYRVNSKPRYGYGKPPHPDLYRIINRNRKNYEEYLKSFLDYKNNFIGIPRKNKLDNSDIGPSWINGYLPGLDSIALYGLLCLNNPKRYYEIGSGNSTLFANKAIKDHHLRTKITSIDPYPRASINTICDTVIREPVEDVDPDVFRELEAGDILFVDNSHRAFMNSDVTAVFLDILTRLKPGVFVEFHDICLPYDYPKEWIKRYYSEQYLLATYILAEGNKFEIILPNTFISRDSELNLILAPLWNEKSMQGVETHGGSFWIKTK